LEPLHKTAEDFKHKNKDAFIPEKTTDELLGELDEATTNQQALSVLNKFTSFYDKDVKFLDKTKKISGEPAEPFDAVTGDTDSLKAFGTSLIRALKPLPKTLTSLAKFDTITLSSSAASSNYMGDRSKEIVYALNMFKPGIVTRFGKTAEDVVGEPLGGEHVILHEIGHSLDPSLREGQTMESVRKRTMADTVGYVVSRLVGVPTEQSFYASDSDSLEAAAEAFAATVDINGTYSLPGPHEWRRFNSPANKQVIANLGRYEETMPGFTSYLIDAKLATTKPLKR
jgi:hypothetical protein